MSREWTHFVYEVAVRILFISLSFWFKLLFNFFDFQMRHKLLDSHANVKDLNLLEAKMNFVKAWQSLPDFGVSLFVVRFHGEKKDELLGIAYNRIMRMSLQTGDHIKTWRYNTIKVRNKELESVVIYHCRLELSLRKTWGYALESMGDWN